MSKKGSNEYRYGNEYAKSYSKCNFNSTLHCKAGSASTKLLSTWAGNMGDNFTEPCILPAHLTASPVPEMSPSTFTSTAGVGLVKHRTDVVVTSLFSIIFQSGCTEVVK
jgi:hypothetical protein